MKLTRRGWLVIGILIGLGLWGLWEVSSHLWYTEGGYCWGTVKECGL